MFPSMYHGDNAASVGTRPLALECFMDVSPNTKQELMQATRRRSSIDISTTLKRIVDRKENGRHGSGDGTNTILNQVCIS